MAQRQQQPLASSLLITGIALLLVSIHFAPDMRAPVLFLFKASVQPITAAFLLISMMFALWAKNKMTTSSVLFASLINLAFLMPNMTLKKAPVLPTSAERLSVATFSTLTRTQNISDILEFIASEQPDLLCLQEVSQTHRKSLLNKLDRHYPHYIESNNNQLTLSRYPLDLIDDSGHSQASVLDHSDWGGINVINVHMPRPYLSNELFASWQQLFKLIDENPLTVLCGDFNITPNNSLYDVLSYDYNLVDSLTSGYGFTFPNAQRKSSLLGPLMRIDYIFTRGFRARETRTINASELSDHRAIMTELSLNK